MVKLYFHFCGYWPEEGVAWSDLVERRAELKLRIVLHVAFDRPQAHSKHYKQNRKQDLGNQALPVSAAVVESLDQDGWHLLPGQSHAGHCGWTGKFWNTQKESRARREWFWGKFTCYLSTFTKPSLSFKDSKAKGYHADTKDDSAIHQEDCSSCRRCRTSSTEYWQNILGCVWKSQI